VSTFWSRKIFFSDWSLSAVNLDTRLNGLLVFAIIPWIGQLVFTLTGVFFLIGWIFMSQFVHEYGKYLARNHGSFKCDHLIVIISSLWIQPQGKSVLRCNITNKKSLCSRSSLFFTKEWYVGYNQFKNRLSCLKKMFGDTLHRKYLLPKMRYC
jgi:hypothetical protein